MRSRSSTRFAARTSENAIDTSRRTLTDEERVTVRSLDERNGYLEILGAPQDRSGGTQMTECLTTDRRSQIEGWLGRALGDDELATMGSLPGRGDPRAQQLTC